MARTSRAIEFGLNLGVSRIRAAAAIVDVSFEISNALGEVRIGLWQPALLRQQPQRPEPLAAAFVASAAREQRERRDSKDAS